MTTETDKFKILSLESIDEDPKQPRQNYGTDGDNNRLLLSLKEIGIQQSIAVMQGKDGRFTIIDGHRRYRCAKKLGWKEIICVVYPKMDREQLEVVRYELQNNRRPWKPSERSEVIARLSLETGKNNKEIARLLHISETTVSNSVLLHNEENDYQKLLQEYGVPISYRMEFRKLRSKLRPIGNHDVPDIIKIVVERVKHHVISNSKDLRQLGRMFLRAHTNQEALIRFLSNPDMTVEELRHSATMSGLSAYIEELSEKIAANLQMGIPFTPQEKVAVKRLEDLLKQIN